MAPRRTANSTSRQTTVPESNGIPPPSTIAAQIVNNATNVNAQPETRIKESFATLLQEFLKDRSADEPDLKTNAQLISVIAGECLDPLLEDNPFAAESLLSQAQDGLLAIGMIIQRTPRVLLKLNEDIQANGNQDLSTTPPVLIWLFPKLLGLLSQSNFEQAQVHVQNLLRGCIRSFQLGLDLGHEAAGILDLYRSCFNSIVNALEAMAPLLRGVDSSFVVTLPPASSIHSLWPESQQAVALPQRSQRSLRSRFQAILTAYRLLAVILSTDGTAVKPRSNVASHESLVVWALDGATSLWRSFRQEPMTIVAKELGDKIQDAFMRSLEAFIPAGPYSDDTLRQPKVISVISFGLAELLQICCTMELSESNQILLGSSLAQFRTLTSFFETNNAVSHRQTRGPGHMARSNVTSVVFQICRQGALFCRLQHDLQLALCHWLPSGEWPAEVQAIQNNITDDPTLQESTSFTSTFRQMRLVKQGRSPKRRRLEQAATPHAQDEVYSRLVAAVNGSTSETPISGLASLQTSIAKSYLSLSEEEQCTLISNMGRLACAGAKCLKMESEYPFRALPCKLCDGMEPRQLLEQQYWNVNSHGEDWKDVLAALLVLTQIEEFDKSRKPRIMMALTIKRVFAHISDPVYLDLLTCQLGQWLISSMSRSLRELRIAAGGALVVFLREDIPPSVRTKNRVSTLSFLRENLAKRGVLSEQETIIMTYGQIARVCKGGDELALILLELIEYLGHTNSVLCGMAYKELLSLAETLSVDPTTLLQPYWRNIGFAVFKDFLNKPQKAQMLSDFLGVTVNKMLLEAEGHVLPLLVLMKRKDVLNRIAKLRGTSVELLCMQPRSNLAAILAVLLCQPGADVEKATMDALVSVAPGFKNSGTDLASLVLLDPVLLACEILKTAADAHEDQKDQVHRGFQTLASLAVGKDGHRRGMSKKKTLSTFFDSQILGIMAFFSEVLDPPTPSTAKPLFERKRCVGALGELISLAMDSVKDALPQIRSCLQSAMADEDLCDQAFLNWLALLPVVDDDDLNTLIDQTLALTAEEWTRFAADTQARAYDTIQNLVKSHNALLQERSPFLPRFSGIATLSKLDSEFSRFKDKFDTTTRLNALSVRCDDENNAVVSQALNELIPFLEANQKLLHESVMSVTPLPILSSLTRSLLDACVRFAENHARIPILCARALGLIGGLDPYRVETVREKRKILVLHNFENANEVIDFSAFLMEEILIKVFHATSNARSQGFLAYVFQELLKSCGFNGVSQRTRSSQSSPAHERWWRMPEAVRNTLTPFLHSKYVIRVNSNFQEPKPAQYPIFNPEISHPTWLRHLVKDLLLKSKENNTKLIFPLLARLIKDHDLSIATFILPFAALNVIISGEDFEANNLATELLIILRTDVDASDPTEAARVKQCSENVFQTLDYFAYWLQEKRKAVADHRAMAGKTGRGIDEAEEIKAITQISRVESVLQGIPAEIISKRSVECGSYARALFHWEQYIRQEQQRAEDSGADFDTSELLQNLQLIYAQIDEPDSIEGISAHLGVLNPDQQVMEHRKAGRWTAAQSWYELELAAQPDNTEIQVGLLTCLKESGQYDSILNYVDGVRSSKPFDSTTFPFAAEAAWSTGKWSRLEKTLTCSSEQSSLTTFDFNVGIGRALLALQQKKGDEFTQVVAALWKGTAAELSPTSTGSLHSCHDSLVRLHVLHELEAISGMARDHVSEREVVLRNLDHRLDLLGAYTSDKQYLLGIRRAAMELSYLGFSNLDIASQWLTSARLARKAEFTTTAHNSVLHAAKLGHDASKIEYSKLLWKDGHHRKAIQNLQGAILNNAFQTSNSLTSDEAVSMAVTVDQEQGSNKVKAQAQLLYAKWLDRAGQTKSTVLRDAYAAGIKTFGRWDKGHYYLGRHYLKLHESEKALPPARQSTAYHGGEMIKLVVENYVRSVVYGTKYYYQTIPKILTLWLDLGVAALATPPKAASGREREIHDLRQHSLDQVNRHLKRYTTERPLPVYAWYTAFPQIITRISHQNKSVWDVLQLIITKVAAQYPQQALWSLMAVTRATQADRAARGRQILGKLQQMPKRKNQTLDLKNLIVHTENLTSGLLSACDAPIEPRVAHVSLAKDLGFNHKLAPSALVVPIEATMLATLPAVNDIKTIRNHNPFPQETVTIASFQDDVLVLSSLQRPRKVNVRGSDGRSYGLLCKPKDDLRKDQRLMEFNAMINRALTREIESSKRRLYIKTYGVTPLNEECGTIEWVEGLKPMRDIIIRLYRQRNIVIDYGEIRMLLNEACSDPSKTSLFTDKILQKFPAVLYEWFIEAFPEPEAWFAARLKYTRSCAVMSIVGHVLGLGDRHGENVLLEEGNGGTFHVDFNCLFDKGLTFEKPELVPFRLTHNMVDAMGPQGIEGPFRKAAELTYTQLRQNQDTLLTILETFVHDPTADFLGGKRKKKIAGVPDSPQEVLEAVRMKVAGLLRGESVPLSVEGYVDALIELARDPKNLCAMYIGWCAFF